MCLGVAAIKVRCRVPDGFIKAMTVKEFLSADPRPENLYVKASCSMEICEGNIRSDNGFLEVRDIGRAGGEPSGIWWVSTKNARGAAVCVHENNFLYKREPECQDK